jgi:primosomal protein N' (replication factor Y)
MYKEIQVAIPTLQKKSVFDYYIEKECSVGSLVLVPFRNKEILGVVISENKSEFPKEKLKKVLDVIKGFSFSLDQIRFMKFVSYYTMASIGNVLKLAIPVDFSIDYSESVNPEKIKTKPTELNDAQKAASEFMISKMTNKHEVFVLDGVTGSGKTETYSEIIKKILEEDSGQVLILMPEITLTNQFVKRFEKIIGFKPDVWHSEVTPKVKKELLSDIMTGKARFIIGARSGLFLPFKDLKLIVVDEEHDTSYKQEDGIVYNARDMAVAYGHFNKMPVVLSSATPSIETIHNISKGKYHRVKLDSRYGGATLPKIDIVDMSKSGLSKGKWISNKLQKKIEEYLSKDKQVMLFLNRRGYAPITLCKSCGHKETCNNCSTFLVTHKSNNSLLCHYCGYKKYIQKDCGECKEKDSLINCGPGVERIAEEVKSLWPEEKYIVVTKDSLEKDRDGETIDRILNKEVSIIIGTQILSKGHHFPALDLVGIVDADIGLFGADLRASERTYQLLTQVSGRAGRETKGEVVVQTYYPSNPIVKALQEGKRDDFYDLEIQSRKDMNMPPFNRLVGVVLSDRSESRLEEVAQNFAKQVEYNQSISVLGPVLAPIYYIRGRYRYRFLVKSPNGSKVQDYVNKWISKVKLPSTTRMKIDVDPYNFM